LAQYAYEIISTLNNITNIVGAKEFIVAVKEEYSEAVEAVESVLPDFKNGKLCLLPEVYPTGDEVVLIYEATKKRVPPGNIPISVGVCVFNVETVFNIYKAINFEKPVTEKYVTVAGEVKNPGVYKVAVGTSFMDLIKLAGGILTPDYEIIKGGPMTGTLSNKFDVVTKTTKGILVFPKNHPVIVKRKAKTNISVLRAKSSCCQCRMCTDLCPRNLIGMPVDPAAFMNAVANGATYDAKVVKDAMYCVSCGLCEMYSCSQGLNPRPLIDEFKSEMRKNGIKIESLNEHKENVNLAYDYRRVPETRLKERLNLVRYDVNLSMTEDVFEPKRVKINLSQSIGSPSIPSVKKGDEVKKGDVIGLSDDGLSLPVHASVDGVVSDVTEKFILISKKD
jgi:Na+-translocating ferredoxin:NAD+ oxidoreductase RnfC subunit